MSKTIDILMNTSRKSWFSTIQKLRHSKTHTITKLKYPEITIHHNITFNKTHISLK